MSSLVDALQVSPARSRRRKPAAAQTLYRGVIRSKMSVGLRVEVVLLDDRRLQLGVGPRLLTHELLAMVASHFTLKEHYYFSLAVIDTTGHYQWLTHDRRVMDHDVVRANGSGGAPVTLYFLIKFYIESILHLQGPQTVELFYQQAKNLVYKGKLELESNTAFKLAALAIQATYGDFADESSTHSQLRKSHLLPTSVIREHPSLQYCEERVAEEHRHILGQTRGHAILQYMSVVERLPTYGVHYYEVRDKSNLPWFLGLSHRGIAQYDFLDKRKPRRIFLWKQLENLYFRERKFSIEVHDPKRVVHTLSSFNLYEDAIEDSRDHQDDLLAAITEATTQVSVSRRTFGPGNVSVYVWFAETQALCKAIWSMAIAQHQFYLDRKTSRNDVSGVQLPELAVELSRSCVSLSTHSSSSNLSRSGSHSSLVNNSLAEDSASTESLHQARMEMHSALTQRRDAVQEKIKEKTEELRLLCLREGELTGELPPEYPATPGQPPPTIRKRVGTSFTLSENLINKIINKQEETVAALELEYEIQGKITSAALRLANESSARKGFRKQRKLSYQQSAQRLKDLEQKLKVAKSKQAATASSVPKQKKKPRPVSDTEGVGIYDENTNPNTTTVSQDSPRDHLRDPQRDALNAEGVSLSPALSSSHPPVSPRTPLPPSTPVRARARRDLSPVSHSLAAAGGVHSAPTSPHKLQSNGSAGSRPTSPNRPHSGYIPSSVYTRSQYRSQQYPTLSTRSQSVPADEGRVSQSRVSNGTYPVPNASIVETPGGLYNIPQQRTSLACHSLDDLDTPSSPINNTITTPPTPPPPQHHNHNQQPYRQRNDSQDRYGSLDRRRANSGRLESRSMEHLDSLPSPTPQSTQHNTAHSQHHTHSPHHLHPSHAASYPHHPHYHNHHFHHTPEHHHPEAMDTTCDSYSNPGNSSFDTASSERSGGGGGGGGDTVDGAAQYRHKGGIQGGAQNYRHHTTSGPGLPTPPAQHHRGASHGAIQRSQSSTVHRLVRTPSGRSYMETTFVSEPNHNQENIPPLRPSSELLPLRPTNGLHHENHPALCSTYSSNTLDPSTLKTVSDLPPLRATKSSCELPPLRATTTKIDPPSSHNSSMNTSMSSVSEEPLMSLAEAARLKKERGKEWYETSLDSPSSGRRTKKSTSMIEMNDSCNSNGTMVASQSNLNLSGSSVGSTGSSSGGSVFQRSDSADTSQNSIPYDSPRNHMIISAGTYQPSREVTKPFEMSDFYKYSTKYRRQCSGNLVGMNSSSTGTTSGSVSSVSSGGDTPLSPVLPPRAQMLVTNTKLHHPPSPNLVAHHSAPAPQQKGVYQPLTPLTCQPIRKGSPAIGEPQDPVGSSWDTAPLHQAVPATVTHKRSATLV